MARNVSINAPRQYTRSYSGFRGVELGRGSGSASLSRLAYAENMYRDYSGDESELIESVPGYRRIAELGGKIHRIYEQKIGEGLDCLLIHAGTGLYRMPISARDSYTPKSPIATLPDYPICFFSHGTSVYALTGSDVIMIDKSGRVTSVRDNPELPYAPIIALNGSPYEQRNLLTDRFREEYLIEDPAQLTRGSSTLIYKVLDPELLTCAVAGINASNDDAVYVPATANLWGKEHRVIRILDRALSGASWIEEIYIAEGVEEIGQKAFSSCTRAKRIVIPKTVTKIGALAFRDCVLLEELYLGSGITEIGSDAFNTCISLKTINFGGSKDMLEDVSGATIFEDYTLVYNSAYGSCALRLPLSTPALSISSVVENGSSLDFECEMSGGLVSAVLVNSKNAGKRSTDITLTGMLMPFSKNFGTSTQVQGFNAIARAKAAEIFDGRVFLGGNPSLPNTVFYSALSHTEDGSSLYFGAENYFNDGVGGYPVCSMLAVRDSLAVFKAGDDGSGSIFYHVPKETGDDYIPKIYPTSYVHSGIGAYGAACSFFDDPLFVTDSGIYALTQKAINYERSVACRSHNVNYDLLRENPEDITLTEWCGYLAVGGRGCIYLADSRATFVHDTGGAEYEWFVLKDIGSYKNSARVYRYDSYSINGYVAHDTPGEICNEVVFSTIDSTGSIIYYANADGKRCTVYPTEEMQGGEFSPAVSYLGIGELLFFGTEDGVLFVFNNDKRGVPPRHISLAGDFNAEEYRAKMGRSIHPDFYSFDSHAPRYAIRTVRDDCDIPHLTKSTVKHSTVIKCKSHTSSEIRFEVGTDRGGYKEITRFPDAELCFAELNFESLTLETGDHHTLPIGEREKNWVEKEISVYSDKYASPIGIYSVTYRYTPRGNIKKN